jgi:hypothetical protein
LFISLFTVKFWKLEGRNVFPDAQNPVVAVFSHFPGLDLPNSSVM